MATCPSSCPLSRPHFPVCWQSHGAARHCRYRGRKSGMFVNRHIALCLGSLLFSMSRAAYCKVSSLPGMPVSIIQLIYENMFAHISASFVFCMNVALYQREDTIFVIGLFYWAWRSPLCCKWQNFILLNGWTYIAEILSTSNSCGLWSKSTHYRLQMHLRPAETTAEENSRSATAWEGRGRREPFGVFPNQLLFTGTSKRWQQIQLVARCTAILSS